MLVYTKVVGRHYSDLDLHVGRAAGAGRRQPPSAVVCTQDFVYVLPVAAPSARRVRS